MHSFFYRFGGGKEGEIFVFFSLCVSVIEIEASFVGTHMHAIFVLDSSDEKRGGMEGVWKNEWMKESS